MILSVLLLIFGLCSGSSGDYLPEFRQCRYSCVQGCPGSPPLPVSLKLTLWKCESECDYQCTHMLTDHHVLTGQRVHQYYGKWPFYRFMGMQEPASVLFSILNGYGHYKGLMQYTRLVKNVPTRSLVILYGLSSINLWFWSAIFHTRDLPFTEKMDYFSSMASLLLALTFAIHRIFNLRLRSITSYLQCGFFALFFLGHISYLSFYRFDYGYNMKASIAVGVTHSLLWILWVIRNYRRRPYAWKIGAKVLAISSAMSLELLDFPAVLRVFDAHSLWHLATIPIVGLYWDFVLEDGLTEARLLKMQ